LSYGPNTLTFIGFYGILGQQIVSAITPEVTPMPEKPYPEYPLWWHPQGYWAKKIRGRVYYFGPRGGTWQEALDEYEKAVHDLQRGREPMPDLLTVQQLCDLFLYTKQRAVETGEFSERSFREYLRVGKLIASHFGHNAPVEKLSPADFGRFRSDLAKGRSVTSLANLVRISRMFFRFAETEELIPGRVRFGTQFSEPSKKAKKKHRNETRRRHGLRMFEAEEIRRLLYAADPVWRAMIYLGINCGFGNTDVSQLRIAQVHPVMHYPRPKTGEDRVNVLWPETLQAVQHAITLRPEPRTPDLTDRVFLTRTGREWVRSQDYVNDEIAKRFSVLLTDCGLKRPGLNFYALRHTVVTIGEELADKPALSLMLGHADASIAAHYRERIDTDRLHAISNHIMLWLSRTRSARGMRVSEKI
jgi:integrase